MDPMGWTGDPFIISSAAALKRFLLGLLFSCCKTAPFLQSARCPFVKQTNLAAPARNSRAVKPEGKN